MSIRIRKAKTEDYKGIIKLYGDFVEGPKRYEKKDNDSFLKFIASPGAFMDLATTDGKIIAFITYTLRSVVRYPKPILEVEELYVHPDYRRYGLGRKLMEHAIDYAKSIPCQYIFLASDKKREEAHNFYKALGFDEYAYHFRLKL